jgi:hypothetical protein
MKPRPSNKQNTAAWTLVEVLVMIVVVAFLLVTFFLLPEPKTREKSERIQCVNNLMQIGVAYWVWAGDNNDKYPMQVSVTNGGVMELVNNGDCPAAFLVISNELKTLNTPKILICPADTNRTIATSFRNGLNNSNISYFVGLDADQTNPQMFLSGDDNFAVGGVPAESGLLELSTNTPIAWTKARHKFVGNIGLADGSVQKLTTDKLQQALRRTGIATNRLALP